MEEIVIDKDQTIRKVFIVEEKTKYELKESFTFKNANTSSKIIVKAIVKDRGFFNYEGILNIPKNSKNVSTNLEVKCLLLTETSRARVVPSLEINENEVKASHSASIGMIEQQHLEYLCSRGLSVEEATDMIVEAFISH